MKYDYYYRQETFRCFAQHLKKKICLDRNLNINKFTSRFLTMADTVIHTFVEVLLANPMLMLCLMELQVTDNDYSMEMLVLLKIRKN